MKYTKVYAAHRVKEFSGKRMEAAKAGNNEAFEYNLQWENFWRGYLDCLIDYGRD